MKGDHFCIKPGPAWCPYCKTKLDHYRDPNGYWQVIHHYCTQYTDDEATHKQRIALGLIHLDKNNDRRDLELIKLLGQQ